jgi:hypothetical protein
MGNYDQRLTIFGQYILQVEYVRKTKKCEDYKCKTTIDEY